MSPRARLAKVSATSAEASTDPSRRSQLIARLPALPIRDAPGSEPDGPPGPDRPAGQVESSGPAPRLVPSVGGD